MSNIFYQNNHQQANQIYNIIDEEKNLIQKKVRNRNNPNTNNFQLFNNKVNSSYSYNFKKNLNYKQNNQLTNDELRNIIKEEFESLYRPYHSEIDNNFNMIKGEINKIYPLNNGDIIRDIIKESITDIYRKKEELKIISNLYSFNENENVEQKKNVVLKKFDLANLDADKLRQVCDSYGQFLKNYLKLSKILTTSIRELNYKIDKIKQYESNNVISLNSLESQFQHLKNKVERLSIDKINNNSNGFIIKKENILLIQKDIEEIKQEIYMNKNSIKEEKMKREENFYRIQNIENEIKEENNKRKEEKIQNMQEEYRIKSNEEKIKKIEEDLIKINEEKIQKFNQDLMKINEKIKFQKEFEENLKNDGIIKISEEKFGKIEGEISKIYEILSTIEENNKEENIK